MDAKWRFGATFIVWSFASAMTIIAFIASSSGSLEDWLAVVPLAVALISTIVIWESASDDKKSSNKSLGSSTVQKPDNTAYNMALLMEMMDDDEREEFKYRLKERILSGDSAVDASIIQEMEKRKRR